MRLIHKVILLTYISFSYSNGQTIQQKEEVLKAKIELGHRLFYDADLSINGTMSCATCHEQRKAFADGNIARRGALEDPGKRNVPGLSNIGLFKNLAWANNHLSGLAEQALMPIRGTDPIEMGMNGYEDEIPKRLSQNECYKKLFSIAFGDVNNSINLANVTLALESFQKTLISNNSIYDQKLKKHQSLPTKEAEKGKKLFFGKAQCNKCHAALLFSDDNFHNVQFDSFIKDDNKTKDYGLFDATKKIKDKNFFRTPSLRNATLTSPYWHDGSAKTLTEAIKKHNLKINQKLSLEEIKKIIAFIDTLTDDSFINNTYFSRPSKECIDIK